ncbi:hypothetical protein C8Q74DRAFT_706934 [Fomes fomentarius]|nr:hypothetical protein C8Q74DRAFT_706934 [Fomes fomentarius]
MAHWIWAETVWHAPDAPSPTAIWYTFRPTSNQHNQAVRLGCPTCGLGHRQVPDTLVPAAAMIVPRRSSRVPSSLTAFTGAFKKLSTTHRGHGCPSPPYTRALSAQLTTFNQSHTFQSGSGRPESRFANVPGGCEPRAGSGGLPDSGYTPTHSNTIPSPSLGPSCTHLAHVVTSACIAITQDFESNTICCSRIGVIERRCPRASSQ